MNLTLNNRTKLPPDAGQIMHALQAHLELRAVAGKPAKAERRVRGHRTLALDDRADAVGGDTQRQRQSVYGQSKWFEEFLAKHVSRM